MSKYSNKDMELLQEAYKVSLLRESAPHMTLTQLEERLQVMSESELKYINNVMDKILNEFWGQQAVSGLKNVGSSLIGGAKNLSKSALNTVSNTAKGVKDAGVAGAKQVAANVGDMYNKGKIQQRQSDALTKGLQSIDQLRGFIQQARKDGVLSGGQNFEDMSITELIDYLQGASQVSSMNAKASADKGFTKGAGTAMKQAFQNRTVK